MKRFSHLFAFVIMVFVGVVVTQANPILPKKARDIAQKYATDASVMVKRVAVERFALPLTANDNLGVRKANTPTLQASPDEQETCASIYIYSRGEGKGFVIVSGDDCLPEVLGVAETGDWDETKLPPALLAWVENYSELIVAAQAANATTRTPRMATGKQNITPLIQTHWTQGWPYNNRAPYKTGTTTRAITGCVATAAAQVMYYWRNDLPEVSQYATPTYSYGDAPVTESMPKGTPFKWQLMQNSYSSGCPDEMQDAVATLMYIVGTSTYLTYSPDGTSGQISKLVDTFNGQFNTSSTCVGKSSYSQTNWEKLVLENLEAGKPMVYAGADKDNSGHAIVLDGYRVSDNLFHFNFGWGGQGDGYYTIDDKTTAVNGFYQSQHMVCNITPKSRNISAKLTLDDNTLLQRVSTPIRVKITNNSAGSFSGVYLYCTTKTKPSGTAQASDKKTVIAPGETVTFEFAYKAQLSTQKYNIFVTDANQTVYAKLTNVGVTTTKAALTLRDFAVSTAEVKQEEVNIGGVSQQVDVHHIYNIDAVITALLDNDREEGTTCQPSVSCVIDSIKVDTFARAAFTSIATTVIEKGASSSFAFNFANLQVGTLYRAVLSTTSLVDIDLTKVGKDSVVWFRLENPDLTVASTTGTNIKMSGHYNAQRFAALATQAEICTYDLTEVSGVIDAPQAANPNALFYVNNTAETRNCNNVIKNGECSNLVLTTGGDFAPQQAFTALKAQFTIPATSGKWGAAVMPFEAKTPAQDLIARHIYQITDAKISKNDTCTYTLQTATPFLYMTATDEPLALTAENVVVDINAENMGTDTLTANWKNTTAASGQFVLDKGTTQYFSACVGETIPAFVPYLNYTKRVAAVPTLCATKDGYSKQLATALINADATLEDCKTTADAQVWQETAALVTEMRQIFAAQPAASTLKATITQLNTAIENLKTTITETTLDGWIDYSGRIKNPSFEKAVSIGWTTTKGTGTTVTATSYTTSLAAFMGNAIGSKILQMTYKTGVKNASVQQTLTDLPRGYYNVVIAVATESTSHHILMTATTSTQTDSLLAAGSKFGPMYLTDYTLKKVLVQDGTLTIGLSTVDGWVKADNVRLYYVADDPTGIEEVISESPESQPSTFDPLTVYDLSGRKVCDKDNFYKNNIPNGIYIVGGKKIMK